MIKNSRKTGFTILEAIVVMGVSVAIMSLGFVGMVSLQRSIVLRNGFNEFTSNVRLYLNNAKNGVQAPDGTIPDYYAVGFGSENNSYEVFYCMEDNLNTLNVDCTKIESVARSDRFSSILISSDCNMVGFGKRTGDIVEISEVGNILDENTCVVNVNHASVSNNLKVIFNTELNTLEYE